MCVLYGGITEASREIHPWLCLPIIHHLTVMGTLTMCKLLKTHVATSYSHICLYTRKCRTFCYLMSASDATSHSFTFHLLQSVPYFAVSRTSQMSYKVCTSQEFLWVTEILLSEHLDIHSLIIGFEHTFWRMFVTEPQPSELSRQEVALVHCSLFGMIFTVEK
jgi:hypothetical protein